MVLRVWITCEYKLFCEHFQNFINMCYNKVRKYSIVSHYVSETPRNIKKNFKNTPQRKIKMCFVKIWLVEVRYYKNIYKVLENCSCRTKKIQY